MVGARSCRALCRVLVRGFAGWQRTQNFNQHARPQVRSFDSAEFTHPNSITFSGGSSELNDYKLSPDTVSNLKKNGIDSLFPVQITCFEPVFSGQNVIAKDKTGSGKTIAYALPLIEKLRQEGCFTKKVGQHPLLIVIVPTRELAMQITKEFLNLRNSRDEFSTGCFFGGVSLQPQIERLKSGIEVAVATPGRLLALIEGKELKLDELKAVVLDETDQMLDMGFQVAVERFFQEVKAAGKNAEDVQHLLFSATMPAWVREMSRSFLQDKFVFVDMLKGQTETIPSTIRHVCVEINDRRQPLELLPRLAEKYCAPKSQLIVFSSTKQAAQDLFDNLRMRGSTTLLTGDVQARDRRQRFEDFRRNYVKCLIATDLVARGLDFPNVDLVVQLGAPQHHTNYVHRAGRAGRAGRNGTCVTFYKREEVELMQKVEEKTKITFEHLDTKELRSTDSSEERLNE